MKRKKIIIIILLVCFTFVFNFGLPCLEAQAIVPVALTPAVAAVTLTLLAAAGLYVTDTNDGWKMATRAWEGFQQSTKDAIAATAAMGAGAYIYLTDAIWGDVKNTANADHIGEVVDYMVPGGSVTINPAGGSQTINYSNTPGSIQVNFKPGAFGDVMNIYLNNASGGYMLTCNIESNYTSGSKFRVRVIEYINNTSTGTVLYTGPWKISAVPDEYTFISVYHDSSRIYVDCNGAILEKSVTVTPYFVKTSVYGSMVGTTYQSAEYIEPITASDITIDKSYSDNPTYNISNKYLTVNNTTVDQVIGKTAPDIVNDTTLVDSPTTPGDTEDVSWLASIFGLLGQIKDSMSGSDAANPQVDTGSFSETLTNKFDIDFLQQSFAAIENMNTTRGAAPKIMVNLHSLVDSSVGTINASAAASNPFTDEERVFFDFAELENYQ